MLRDVLLPPAETEEQFMRIRRDESLLRPGVTELVRRLGLHGLGIERFSDGSLPVYAVGDRHVLKLYPDVYRHERFNVESSVLQAVQGRLPIPTPEVRQAGAFEGWGYVLMARLHGESLATAWPKIAERDRRELAGVLGETLAALHTVSSPELDVLDPPDWESFLRHQRDECVAHHRADELDDAWPAQIPEFLESVVIPSSPPVLLHTEIMREHLRVVQGPDGWGFSGLFDFEPAMRGAREYEFVSVGLFVSCGDGDFLRRLMGAYGYRQADLRRLMGAYGYRQADLDEAFQRRLLAYALLHRYSSLAWYLTRLPAPPLPTLDSLATCWWALR